MVAPSALRGEANRDTVRVLAVAQEVLSEERHAWRVGWPTTVQTAVSSSVAKDCDVKTSVPNDQCCLATVWRSDAQRRHRPNTGAGLSVGGGQV
jgi:hypothetical protein